MYKIAYEIQQLIDQNRTNITKSSLISYLSANNHINTPIIINKIIDHYIDHYTVIPKLLFIHEIIWMNIYSNENLYEFNKCNTICDNLFKYNFEYIHNKISNITLNNTINSYILHIINIDFHKLPYTIRFNIINYGCLGTNVLSLSDKEQRVYIRFFYLCMNPCPDAICEIEAELHNNWDSHLINWHGISKNNGAMHIIKHELLRINHRISWIELLQNINPDTYELVKSYKILDINNNNNNNNNNTNTNTIDTKLLHIYWKYICGNPVMIHLITKEYVNNNNSIFLNWDNLSKNPAAIDIIENEINNNNSYNINYNLLCTNKNPKVYQLLKPILCGLKKRPLNFDILNILKNPGIFEYDYTLMKESKANINRDLIEYTWNPIRYTNNNL